MIVSLRKVVRRSQAWLETFDVRSRADAFIFGLFTRADYYRYLADMIEGTQGSKSLLRIFEDDASRFAGWPRGRLSARWARGFARGGSLDRTFSKTLPSEDIAVLDTAQQQGDEEALKEALRELAANTDLQRKAIAIVVTTMFSALTSLAFLFVMILGTPSFTVPELKKAFSLIPAENWPQTAKRLFHFADLVETTGLWVTLASIALIALSIWSLSNLTGPVRLFFDKYGLIWGMYRDFQSIRTLAGLATAINQKAAAKGLRESLAMQIPGSSRWKRHHLDQMIAYVDTGSDNSLIFTTGTLDRATAWYIQDLIDSRGLADALGFVKSRLEERVIKKLILQSLVLSWVLILSVLAAATALMLWHYAAVDSLSASLQNLFY